MLITCIIINRAWSCQVDLHPYLVKVGSDVQNIVKSSDCSKDLLNFIQKELSEKNGLIPTTKISSIAKINPQKVFILSLKDFIDSKLKENIKVVGIGKNRFSENIVFKNLRDLRFSCSDCNSIGKTTVTLSHLGKKAFFNVKLGRLNKAYVLTESVDPGQVIQRSSLKKKTILRTNNTVPFADIKNLHHFVSQKRLRKGDVLNDSNVRKANLVKFGNPVTCIYESKGILLESRGIARGNGRIRDVIKLIHPKTKFEFYGKVIGNNKVKVEL